MAAELAELTHSLSRCCTAKDIETFAQFGLSIAEGQFLLVLAERGPVLPSIAAEVLGVCRSRVTPLSQGLIDRGLVARRESAEDRRAKTLSLTPKGRQVSAAAADYRMQFHQRLLERFGESERQRVLETLADLRDKMTEVRRESGNIELNHLQGSK